MLLKKPEHYGKKEADDDGQASGQTDAFHQCGIWRERKKNLIKISIHH